MNETRLPTLSVITVVYNDVRSIGRTIQSIVNQTYPNVQYIVIDGRSTDGTMSVIEEYNDKIDILISEQDSGIYDAMNKGLKRATGDYVLFMNSGDEIWALDTVEKVFNSGFDADIYYGETEMFNQAWESLGRRRHRVPEAFNWKSFRFGMNISHQAIYIRRSITDLYDSKYELSSDIDWIIKAAKKARKVINVHAYVAKYMVGGSSKKHHRQSLHERFLIFNKYYGLIPNIVNHAFMACRLSWYYLRYGKTND